jgi:hypothetical protein
VLSCEENGEKVPNSSVSHIIKNTQGVSRDFLSFNLNYSYDADGRIKNINGIESLRSIRCNFYYNGQNIIGQYDNLTTSEHRTMQIILDADSNTIAFYKDEYSNVVFNYALIEGRKKLILSYNVTNGDTLFANPIYKDGNLIYCVSMGIRHFLFYEGNIPNISGINTLPILLALGKYDKVLGILPYTIGSENANLITKDSAVGDRNYAYEYHFDALRRIDYMLLNGTTTTFKYY